MTSRLRGCCPFLSWRFCVHLISLLSTQMSQGMKLQRNIMTVFYWNNYCIGDFPLILNYCHRASGTQFQICEFCLKLEMAHTDFFKLLEVYTEGNTTIKFWTRSTVEPLFKDLPYLAHNFSDPDTVIWMVNFLHLGFPSSSLPVPTALKKASYVV